ncbi:coenzyme Q biosynthesis protein Coq4 [Colletotrichum kahawae]|uniref:4-hydroxy-3-methoxy-5-polyprenylbenzoate decarboxylase n=1 Tax=Colletotrichum kahawae TaxID=34407 RepID=A0AAE0D7G2_COLKA|nr:coenzyme Q biosynthesis protein Coq4 [Colletotrichum kahawae]
MQALRTLPRANGALPALCAATTTTTTTPSSRPFSVLNRPPPNYDGHVPLNRIEKASLAIGAGIWSLLSPYRADLIAAVGEATATPYFIYRLRDAMLADPTGRRILRDRPRMTSTTLNLARLRQLPENSVGRAYVGWLDAEGVSPDTRTSVRFIDDPECAYVMQRYRECHDFYHALTGLPIVREGEVALKAFEFANTLIPMTGLATMSYVTMKKGERRRFREIYGPWAVRNGLRAKEVINIYWEEQMERDVDELRAELGIERPPNMRAIRKKEREERKKAMEKATAGP